MSGKWNVMKRYLIILSIIVSSLSCFAIQEHLNTQDILNANNLSAKQLQFLQEYKADLKKRDNLFSLRDDIKEYD